MSQLLWANNAGTTLATSISNSLSVTSINVAAGTGALFPSPGAGQYFKVSLAPASGTTPAPEIMHCTAVSGDTLTVVRAQEGTSAQAWGSGSLVSNWLTRDTMAVLAQVIPYAGNPNGNVAGEAAGATAPPTMVWDSTNNILWQCTTSGPASTAGWTAVPSGFSNIAVFNVSGATVNGGAYSWSNGGNWTAPAGIFRVRWRLWGGGGGTGGVANSSTAASGGAGGGAYAEGYSPVTPSGTYAVTVGAGGTSGAGGGSPGNGTDGGDSSFASFGTAGGGKHTAGVASGLGAAGVGGTPTGGQVQMVGGAGSAAEIFGSYSGGQGGSAPSGGQGGQYTPGTAAMGNFPGGGAGGASGLAGAVSGAAGANGLVILEY